jgi:predicted HD phosphohydrolase
MDTVSFTRMEDGTAEDWALLDGLEAEFNAGLPGRILTALGKLQDTYGGYQVTRLTHSLQAATRALRDGKDEEYLVATLVHDVGDDLAPYTHGEMAASLLKPFVRDELCWMVKHHGAFQLYFFHQLSDEERNTRERWRDHPNFGLTAEFCERYDQVSFDPAYPTLPIAEFEPLVQQVFAEPRYLAG